MSATRWKVGELAQRTGVSVRTLHHYDAIGLLSPSHRSAAGHRLYGRDDLARLQRILSLRQLGFSLDEIAGCLDSPDFTPERVLAMHIERLDEQIELQRQLRRRLAGVRQALVAGEDVSSERFIGILEGITMIEQYYTPEQLKELEARRKTVGPERMRQAEAEWRELMAEVRVAMDRGDATTSDTVRALARRWNGLVEEFTGGDPGIRESLGQLYAERGPELGRATGFDFDPAMFAFMGRAIEDLRRNDDEDA